MTDLTNSDPAEGSEEIIDKELERQSPPRMPTVSETLREKRLSLGYTLDDLAVTTGLTVSEIETVEEGVAAENDNARRIASVLNVELDDHTKSS